MSERSDAPVAGPVDRELSPAYARVEELIAARRCVILDGGVATEIERVREGKLPAAAKQLWGTWALYQAPQDVLEVHRRYLDAGFDVISTDTWSILSAPELELSAVSARAGATHWMSAARLGIRLAQQAVAESDGPPAAVAFAISEEVTNPERQRTVELLTRVFEDDRPDLILMETLSLIRDLTVPTVQTLLDTGIPVWLAFRRCLQGPCGVYGQHWGGPEGDSFLRSARRFEEMGVGALLINCLPVDHVPGMISALRDFIDLPLGVYPNLGHLGATGWTSDGRIGPEEYAALALQWRDEGADIIGGCCGVTPEHVAAVGRAVVEDPSPSSETPRRRVDSSTVVHLEPPPAMQPWTDEQGRLLSPLPFPELALDPGVFVPTQGSLLVWQHLFRSGAGEGKRCLDVGCGSGILAIQLALNGAAHVHAIDIDRRAVVNTMTNAFRNGLADCISSAEVDLYVWESDERYDLIVASLYQMPVDPYEEYSGHRPLDFWGRNVFDHFLRLLPHAMTDDGVAYVMQLSIMSQQQTVELLQEVGLDARVVDFRVFSFPAAFARNEQQIARVEQLSDAYHLRIGGEELLVAYLLEVTRRPVPALATT